MAGGGTGGHVIPALAVAREFAARGHEVLFVGTERGVEGRLVPAAGFRLEKIQVGGLKNLGIGTRVVSFWRLVAETAGQIATLARMEAGGCFQHGRLCGRPAGAGRAAARRPGGRDGAERRSGVHQPLDCAMGEARPDQLSRRPKGISRGPHRS